MPAASRRRVATVAVAAVTASLLACLAPASWASPTLYACVKKNGAARLFASKPKCRKGEKRLSWNAEGPPGAAGTNGVNGGSGPAGLPGLNGAVAGYTAASEERDITTATSTEPATLITMKLPPGTYQVQAVVRIEASSSVPEGWPAALGVCAANYAPASGPGETGDTQYWFVPMSGVAFVVVAGFDNDALWFPASSASAAQVTIRCWDTFVYGGENKAKEKGVVKIGVISAKVLAIQTSRNVAG